jgi:hypothetical protein
MEVLGGDLVDRALGSPGREAKGGIDRLQVQ